MHILTVIPLKRKVPFQELTYFHHSALSIGALVEIPFQKKEIIAIVLSTTPLASLKAEIKGKPYTLKKITRVLSGHNPFWHSVIESAKEVSRKNLTSLSHLIEYCTHDYIREKRFDTPKHADELFEVQTPEILFGTRDERTDKIKRLVRESFAKKQTVVIIAPTIKAVEVLYDHIRTGIQPSTFFLHGSMKTKEQKETFSEMFSRSTPFCLITTPHFALLPPVHVGRIIIEDESHFLYERSTTELLPIRDFFIGFAKRYGIALTLSDGIPRFESIWNYDPTLRIPRDYAPDSLVFLEKEKVLDMVDLYIKKIVKRCITEKKSLFLYTNRKGFAPLSRCADCGTEISCPTCSLPLTLRIRRTKEGAQKREFCCLACGEVFPTTLRCSNCESWNIKVTAVGTQGYVDALTNYVGDTIPVYTIDDTATPDSKEIIALTEVLKKKKSYILVGTEKALPYMPAVDYSVIPIYDRILSTPGTRITEGLLRLLYTLQERTHEYVYIGTNDASTFTKSLREKNIQKIIDEEYQMRKSLLYPPFGHLLVVSCAVSASLLQKTRDVLMNLFADVDFTIPQPKIIDTSSMRTEIRLIAQVSEQFIQEQGPYILEVLKNEKIMYRTALDPERINFL